MKNADAVHEQIWKQCLGELKVDAPVKIVEPMEEGFEVPYKASKGPYEVQVKEILMQSINASLGRLQVIKLTSL